jgi:hypothetical protein
MPAYAQGPDVITDIRVHGNHTTADAEIVALSGLARGEIASDERLRRAERLLLDTGRFAAVELRRRFASIEDPSVILVMIVVDEHDAVREGDLTPGPVARLRAASMWLPIISYSDGYGFTYGARVSVIDVLGNRSRVSVPMTWGGERGIALEAQRTLGGPVRILSGSLGVRRRINPHFDVADLRQEARLDAERPLLSWLRAGAGVRIAQVEFGGDGARHTGAGMHATLDTRVDPSFPRNAVHAQLGWEHLWFSGAERRAPAPTPGGAGRWLADVRGYVGVAGSAVLALRGQIATSDAPLPAPEQALLGGGGSLRGYRTGYRAGDNMAALSAELRVPLTSPRRVGRFGVKAFVDSGAVWASGERLRRQRFDRGAGAGVYFGAAALSAGLDIAWPESGKPRAHIGLGVSF